MVAQLTWRFILRNIVPIIAAIITVTGLIFVNVYFKPDLRFEEGSYYRSGDRAITSLRLQNYGHGDAEEIRVSASFPDTILDVSTSDEGLPFTVKSGGKGSKAVSGAIQRLVPAESVYLYFAVKNPEGPIPGSFEKFIADNGIVYKGGIAKQGKPFSWLSFLLGIISAALPGVMVYFFGKKALNKSLKRLIPPAPYTPTPPPETGPAAPLAAFHPGR